MVGLAALAAPAQRAEAGCTSCVEGDPSSCAVGYACVYDPAWESACCLLRPDAGASGAADATSSSEPDAGASTCALPCGEGARCDYLGDGWICGEGACCIAAPTCDVYCDTSADCRELGEGYVCTLGTGCCAWGGGVDAGSGAPPRDGSTGVEGGGERAPDAAASGNGNNNGNGGGAGAGGGGRVSARNSAGRDTSCACLLVSDGPQRDVTLASVSLVVGAVVVSRRRPRPRTA